MVWRAPSAVPSIGVLELGLLELGLFKLGVLKLGVLKLGVFKLGISSKSGVAKASSYTHTPGFLG